MAGLSSSLSKEFISKKKCQGCLKTMITRNKSSSGNKLRLSNFLALPDELIIEILAYVASSSSADLFNAKLSCKELYKAAEDRAIYRQISLEKFPFNSWGVSKQATSFLDRCRKSGNPETLFRQGVVEYFGRVKVEEGLKYLERAAKSGNYTAAYTLGIILLCCEDKCKQVEGMELVDNVKRKKKLTESRERLKDIIWSIWVSVFLEAKPNTCPMKNEHKKKEGWPKNVDDDEINCQECSCDREIIFVCKSLRGL